MDMDIGRTRSGLRYGYTTGSCAAAAAKAAAMMLFTGEDIRHVRLQTPKGIELWLDVEAVSRTRGSVRCAIEKFSGDDPDVTNGLLVFAEAEKCPLIEAVPENAFCQDSAGQRKYRLILDGGSGVGRVSGTGLEQKPGQAAINKVPRRMIFKELEKLCDQYDFSGTVRITVSVPEGEKTAQKTFNPRLGILGGLSILGTTGIVEPMSEKALTDTIYLEMKMLRERGSSCCYVVPGNYGMDFLSDVLHISPEMAVKCSNYVGETIDDAGLLGMKGILLIGHVGKFIKLAAGVMNTHSRQADCRMEVLAAHAAMAGVETQDVRRIMACINTSEAVRILKENGLLVNVMDSVMKKMYFHLRRRAADSLELGVIMFSEEEGILGQAGPVSRLTEAIERKRNGGLLCAENLQGQVSDREIRN